jgi:hypothetical protein
MMTAFRAGWRHARERDGSRRVYATRPKALAYWLGRLSHLCGHLLPIAAEAETGHSSQGEAFVESVVLLRVADLALVPT